MSYNVTDRQLYNILQYTLIETPNNGASFGSNLYTVTEVTARANYRLDLFNKLSGIFTKNAVTDTVASTVRNQVAVNLADLIDILEVSYNSGTGWNVIPPGSATEADSFITDQVGAGASVTIPFFYTLDTAPLMSISLYPPPSSAGTLRMAYIPKIGLLPTVPDGTSITLSNDFTPYIKYGILADLFGKSGETYDPIRAQVCEQLFQVGAEVAKSWISGSQE